MRTYLTPIREFHLYLSRRFFRFRFSLRIRFLFDLPLISTSL